MAVLYLTEFLEHDRAFKVVPGVWNFTIFGIKINLKVDHSGCGLSVFVPTYTALDAVRVDSIGTPAKLHAWPLHKY